MIKPILILSLFIGILFGSKQLLNTYSEPVLNLTANEEIPQAKQASLEKTVSEENIHALMNADELSPEQAKIFYATLPMSLLSNARPSALDVDEQGQLIINMKVKRLFEFYLSAMGEDTLAECILRIRHELASQLEGVAYAAAIETLEGFLQYQNNIGEIKNDFLARYSQDVYSLERVSEMKQAVRQSRGLFFSPQAANAFYQQEDEYDDYMLKKVAIKSNSLLTNEQRLNQYELLDSQSPDWISQQNKQANLVSSVQAQEKAIRENGDDEYAIQVLREKNYGVEVTQKLALLDIKRDQWRQRVSLYRSEIIGIASNQAYSLTEQEQLLDDARRQHFSGSELIRIEALDKIEGDKL